MPVLRHAHLSVLVVGLGGAIAYLRDDCRIGEGRGVTQVSPVGHVAQQSPHDLARPRLGQVRHDEHRFGTGGGTELGRDVLSHLLPASLVKVTRVLVDVFASGVCAVIAWQAWRYLQLEIEFEDQVLIDTPAWIAHIVVPLAFALVSYRFVVLAAGRLVTRKADA